MKILTILLLLLSVAVEAKPSLPEANRMVAHVGVLARKIGVRPGGSEAERRGADYISGQLQNYGYRVVRQEVPLPDGRTTLNLIAEKEGVANPYVVGAHIDSKPPSPGGNDNATGVAVVLELARLLPDQPLRFVFFGCEEVIDEDSDHHHFGSRYYVDSLGEAGLGKLKGMICIDAVGAGSSFVIGTMTESSPLSLALRQRAVACGYPVLDMVDPGWSDHEPFYLAGVETAYVRWRIDSTLHSRGDDARHVSAAKMMAAARTVLSFLRP